MKKLILNLDALKVETFDPEAPAGEQQGSVVAHQISSLECPTYNRQDFACYASLRNQPGAVCTPVCGRTAYCVLTEYPCLG